jgi:excisionase family DNA binding protein
VGNPRKVFCELLEAACYEDRCLFRLCQVVDGNKTCERCIVREVDGLRHRIKKENKKSDTTVTENEANPAKFYTIEEMERVLGKDPTTIRKWAKLGKIPAQKVGRKYRFLRGEIERWLLEEKEKKT